MPARSTRARCCTGSSFTSPGSSLERRGARGRAAADRGPAGRGPRRAHLEARYGIAVSRLAELDLGVYRVERADGPARVARVFAAMRPEVAAAGDAVILAFLAGHASGSERVAAPEPASVLDGHSVLVTELESPS
jgi:hypothetical protein